MSKMTVSLLGTTMQCTLTSTFVNADRIECINFNHEVVLEEDEADDGEEIDEDECKHGSQQDRSSVLRHRTYHIEQRLFLVDYVQQLTRNKAHSHDIQCRSYMIVEKRQCCNYTAAACLD